MGAIGWAVIEQATGQGGSTVVVYLGALGVFLGAVSTAYGVWYTAQAKKRSATREELGAVNDALGEITDRWEQQARSAWVEIDALKTRCAVAETRADHLERELRTANRKCEECQERLDEWERQHE